MMKHLRHFLATLMTSHFGGSRSAAAAAAASAADDASAAVTMEHVAKKWLVILAPGGTWDD